MTIDIDFDHIPVLSRDRETGDQQANDRQGQERQVPTTAEGIAAELERLDALGDNMSAADVDYAGRVLDAADRLADETAARRSFADRRAQSRDRLAELFAAGHVGSERGDSSGDDELAPSRDRDAQRGRNPWDLDQIVRASPDEIVSRALDAAERANGIDDVRRERLTTVIERGEGDVARVALMTTQPAYRRAFGRLLRGDSLDSLDDAERQAIEAVEPLRRAMSASTNGAGGYLIPTDIEPAVTLADDGTPATFYELARKVQTTANTYRVNQSGNAAWSWDGENTEVSDDMTTLTNTDITLYFAQGFIPMSIASVQSIGGAIGIASELLGGGYSDLIGAATTTGTGSSQPVGLITALSGGSSEIASATTDTFAVGDVYAVRDALGQRFRRNATWAYEISVESLIRQFATDDGHALLARLGDGEAERLLGRPTAENPDMDGTINATQDNRILVLGDFRHYVVAEAIGTLVEVIPHVFGGNGRPIGARGLYMATRFGADSVLDNAFRMLNVT